MADIAEKEKYREIFRQLYPSDEKEEKFSQFITSEPEVRKIVINRLLQAPSKQKDNKPATHLKTERLPISADEKIIGILGGLKIVVIQESEDKFRLQAIKDKDGKRKMLKKIRILSQKEMDFL